MSQTVEPVSDKPNMETLRPVARKQLKAYNLIMICAELRAALSKDRRQPSVQRANRQAFDISKVVFSN